ncbi:unannotated protein [freshwater metagenome]|uniref:Unannotated protein n=1 Tax=freshwater metagenome TaxID=449393 RepID=A0A6J7GMX7_9ZZZZ|nr:hypothetical protein [Actinomycetota bacterium]
MSAVEQFAAQVAEDVVWSQITHGTAGGWTVAVDWNYGTYDNGMRRGKDTRASGNSLEGCCRAALDSRPKPGEKPSLRIVRMLNGDDPAFTTSGRSGERA